MTDTALKGKAGVAVSGAISLRSVPVALAALWANKMRSGLTILGVVIGVAAVIIMVSIVEGFKGKVIREFEGLGSSLIIIFFDPSEASKRAGLRISGLTMEDAEAIEAQCPLIKRASPEISVPSKVVYAGRDMDVQVKGVVPEYLETRSVKVAMGRFINQRDVDTWSKAVVIGHEVYVKLFQSRGYEPLGADIKIGPVSGTIVGVLERKGRAFDEDYDKAVYVPLTSAHKRVFGSRWVGVIFAQAVTPEKAEEACDQVWRVLMRRHGNRPDFVVDTQLRLMQTVGRILGVLALVLGGIAGLSLLVGGIGIMNIMLVSVTERTREIGIRMAVGAKRKHILLQFLTESATLSSTGGAVGITLGCSVSWFLGRVLKERMPTEITLWSILLAFGFSLAVGLFFGIYPAYRAAKLDPIAALRYE
ncbi:MAG: ABC transporter permease [Armatimonadota bacterium]